MACVDSIPGIVRCLVSGPPPEGQSVCIAPPQGLRFLGCLGCCLPKPVPGQSSGFSICGVTLCLCCGGPKRTAYGDSSLGAQGCSDNAVALKARWRQGSHRTINGKDVGAAGKSADELWHGAVGGPSSSDIPLHCSTPAQVPPDTRPIAATPLRARAAKSSSAAGGRSNESPF